MIHYKRRNKYGNIFKITKFNLRPEWEDELEKLKKEKFNDVTEVEMFRYLISLGLNAIKSKNE